MIRGPTVPSAERQQLNELRADATRSDRLRESAMPLGLTLAAARSRFSPEAADEDGRQQRTSRT